MRLSDVMSAAGLHTWAEIGLIVSFATFVALLLWLFVIRRGTAFDIESALPLHDELTFDSPAVTEKQSSRDGQPEEAPSR